MPAPIRVDVSSARGFGRFATLVRRSAKRCLDLLGETPCELSVALVDDETMRGLNAEWRGKDRTTDVLSFSQRGGDGVGGELLGDVVISIPTARRQASERGKSVEQEITELLVHGILHLLGYDHERSPAEARRMFAKSRQLLAALAAGE